MCKGVIREGVYEADESNGRIGCFERCWGYEEVVVAGEGAVGEEGGVEIISVTA